MRTNYSFFTVSSLALVMAFLVFTLSCQRSGLKGDIYIKTPAAQPCTIANTPTGAHISCPDGTAADVYNGTPGLNAATVSAVQFCPGVTVYPSAFLEVGLCIDNKLYAVYSTNGGFLSYLPPGAYQSNAVGSSCNFTVTDGCEISY